MVVWQAVRISGYVFVMNEFIRTFVPAIQTAFHRSYPNTALSIGMKTAHLCSAQAVFVIRIVSENQ